FFLFFPTKHPRVSPLLSPFRAPPGASSFRPIILLGKAGSRRAEPGDGTFTSLGVFRQFIQQCNQASPQQPQFAGFEGVSGLFENLGGIQQGSLYLPSRAQLGFTEPAAKRGDAAIARRTQHLAIGCYRRQQLAQLIGQFKIVADNSGCRVGLAHQTAFPYVWCAVYNTAYGV
ncbi:hypothetical protein ABE561_22465, partial [Pseudomonas asiatica]|uniref:hypothetical protein n=1 Tax=Pseudomonas asiatica TaxID=2219225 RepID=UPI00320B001A